MNQLTLTIQHEAAAAVMNAPPSLLLSAFPISARFSHFLIILNPWTAIWIWKRWISLYPPPVIKILLTVRRCTEGG